MTSIDVLLTHSNHLFYDSKQVQKMQPYPPLQTLLAAALLRQSGMQVSVLDATLDPPEQTLEAILGSCKPNLVAVCEDDFNFLSKMCLARNRQLAFWTAQVARAHGCKTAVHSSDSSDHVKEYLDAGFDFVLIGEVEDTLLELASQRAIENIPGLAYRSQDTGGIHYNTPRLLRTDLDALPFPAWDLIDMRPYRDAWRARHGYFSLNMISSRGCPFRCNWCAKPVYGNSYHVRSPHLVAQEMLFLKQHYQPDQIWFADDIFAISGRWTMKFSHAVDSLQAQIPFKMQSRCDLMTGDNVQALKRAGCREVWMGAESGSQRILDAMEKGIQVEQIYQARAYLARHGIRAGWFLQFGYPGESWEDIEATIRMVRQTKPDDVGISVSYPLPGTKFHQLVSSQIGRKTHWLESGDLAMIFRGAYSSEVYRALAEALHLEVRAPENKGAIQNAWNRVFELKDAAPFAAEVAS